MFKKISFCLLLIFSISVNGQNQTENISNPLNNNKASLKTQHQFILDQSRTYVNNKVVKTEWLNQFYKNATDSLKNAITSRNKFETSLLKEKEGLKVALESLNDKKEEIKALNLEKDGILLFGSSTSKSSYKTIMWSIIISLFALLLFFLFKYKNSSSTTKESKEKLEEVENELEETKKKMRTKEQELMRKLQDEINKHA